MPQFITRTLALIAAAAPLVAQPAARTFSRPDATFPEPFTVVSGVRELADGRVLVSDARDRALQLLDFRTGSAASVGRAGGGPGEWGVPGRLHAMPGDSTLMSDFQNGRYLIILPDGTPGPTFRIAQSSPASFSTLLGVDAAGRMIVERVRVDRDRPMAGSLGAVDILRFDRATERTDTLGQRADPKGEHAGATALPGGLLQTFTNLPLAARDIALVASGRVVIVRADPYRIEWIGANDRRFVGPIASASAIRVNDAEKAAFVRGQIRPGSIVVSGGPGAAAAPRGGAGAAGARAVTIDAAARRALTDPEMVWPDRKPPFLSGAAVAAPGGRVWVLRTRAHDDPIPTYDVFEPDGRVAMRVALPARTRLAGFGRGVAYLVRTDDDDLQHLERHRLP